MALNGIDISHWQKGLDLSKVPCDFAIMKATEGTGYVDPFCDPWVQVCKRLGKLWGFYHFLAGGDPVKEADHFVDSCLNYFGEGIPVLDYEMYGRIGTAGAKKFLDRVYERTKVRCVVYMSRSVCKEEDWSAIAPNHALWVAQYANNKPTGYQSDPWFPSGSIGAFKFVTMHQYTSTGRLSGYNGNLDLDIAYLDRDGWNAIARGDRGAAPKPEPEPAKPLPDALKSYKDLDPDAWYIGAVEWAVKNGYMKGYSSESFGPNDILTRAQAVCIIANYEGFKAKHTFSDVVPGNYYYDAVEWAHQNGIATGYGDSFGPDDKCTREMLCCMLNNLAGSPKATGDAGCGGCSSWAKEAVAWCIEEKIVGNDGQPVRPLDPCTRAEAAAMLKNFSEV